MRPAVAHRVDLVLKQADPLLETLATLPGLTLAGRHAGRAGAGPHAGPTGKSWPTGTTPARRVRPGAAPRRRGPGAGAADHQRQAAARLLGDGLLAPGRLPAAGPLVLRRRRRAGASAVRGRVRRLSGPAPAVRRRRNPIRGSGRRPRGGTPIRCQVPLSLRERGDRAMRGRTSRVPDPTADRLRLTAEARAGGRAAAGRRGRAGAGRRAARRDHLTRGPGPAAGPGGRSAGAAPGEQVTDHDVGLRLRAVPGPDTVVSSPDGTTTFVGLSLTVSAAPARARSWPEPEWSVAQ